MLIYSYLLELSIKVAGNKVGVEGARIGDSTLRWEGERDGGVSMVGTYGMVIFATDCFNKQ